jgi:hypothetical protein
VSAGRKAQTVLKAMPEFRELPDPRAKLVHRVRSVPRVLPARTGRKAKRVARAPSDPPDCEEQLDQLG